MHDIINQINWEHIILVAVSILGAFGASRAWLKRLCAQLDDNKGEVEIMKQDIKDMKALLDVVMKEGKK